jgi:hypothetical protein
MYAHRKKAKRLAPGLSSHAVKLLERRRQRLHEIHSRERKEHNPPVSPAEPIPPAVPVTTPTAKVADASAGVHIHITLLGRVTMTIHIPDGSVLAVPLDLNPRTIQLLAHIGWKLGTPVKRNKLIEDIWGIEGTGEEEAEKRQGWAFDDARKALRAAILEVVKGWNNERGKIWLDPKDPKLDIFCHKRQLWWLSLSSKVVDLEAVEGQYQIIMQAKKQGMLANSVPEYVKVACDALIAAYTGDFLEEPIRCHPPDLRTWANAWVREPITYYRDCYLQAVWYAAEYEVQAGQRIMERAASDMESRLRQRECWARAAELYRMYAMYACNNKYDAKVYFGLTRGSGERVVWSERALRNCIMLCAKLGDLYLIHEIYNAYYDQMRNISDENWEPSDDTLRAAQAARERAAAYRPEE